MNEGKEKEIAALFTLIDDPDEEVYHTVEQQLMRYGLPIVPSLEHLWEHTISEAVQERIETIIHKLHFSDLQTEFTNWKRGDAELLFGALLVAKYQFPEMAASTPLQEIEKIRRNVWIEMNSYLTPLEQVKVLESILYNYYKLRGGEISYNQPNEFTISKLLETKKGNAITTGILYLIICEMLDIPIQAIQVPRQFLLAYFQPGTLATTDEPISNRIKFYIDPSTGTAYSHQDIETYFRKISVPPVPAYFRPMNNRRIIQLLLEEFAKCFDNDKQGYKYDELMELSAWIEEE
jgi:regulator of sirC expression with transglutaminase-like and TPR domain